MPALSIITVCYNEAARIALTCESIVKQTFQCFEWIVIDGGSTDGTLEILKQYATRINYFVSEKDRGIYHAMNKGIIQAHGTYLLFLNGGDYFYESETLAKVFASGKTLEQDIYYGDILLEKSDGFKRRSLDFTNYYAMFALRTFPHQVTFIKRALFEVYGLHDESFTICADLEFFLRVFVSKANRKRHAIEHLPFIVSVYENIEGVSSKNIALRDAENIRARRKYYPVYYLFYIQRKHHLLRLSKRCMAAMKNIVKHIIVRKTPCRKSA